MPTLRTHYQNLKVDEKAPASVIKAAYRALSLEYHPDRSKDDPEAERIFKIIQTSYEILSDPVQRKKHDEWIKSQRERSSNQEHKKKSSYTKKEEPQYTKVAFYSRPLSFAVFVAISAFLMWNLNQSEQLDKFLSRFLNKKEPTTKKELDVTYLISERVVISRSNSDTSASAAEIAPEVSIDDSSKILESSELIVDRNINHSDLEILTNLLTLGLLSEAEFQDAVTILAYD
ncbi:J domain-containing protein [Gammaproteobacteria bacterium]|nr:J domain-containing protein [Gammaproteobacteria bacterium]